MIVSNDSQAFLPSIDRLFVTREGLVTIDVLAELGFWHLAVCFVF